MRKRQSGRYGDGSVWQRGRHWWVCYWRGGKQHREPTKAKTKSQARDILRDKLAALVGGQAIPGDRRYTVADAIDDYLRWFRRQEKKSLKQTASHAEAVRQAIGHHRVADLTGKVIGTFADEWLASGSRRGSGPLSKPTVNRRLGILSAALGRARIDGAIANVPPIEKFKESPPRKGFVEPEDFDAILEHLPEHLRDAARFAYLVGWRKGAVIGLRWEHVDRRAREIRLPDSKNDDPQTMPLFEGVAGLDGTAEIIERCWQARTGETGGGATYLSEYVFHRRGRQLRDFRKAWGEACKAAGMSGQLFHDLRRSAVRNLTRSGVPQSVAMTISGHRTASVFRRYDIASTEDKAEALRKTLERSAQRQARKVQPIRKSGGSR